MSSTAEDRGWGPHGGLGGTELVRVRCPGLPLRVRSEVAPLFAVLVDWLGPERARLELPSLASAGAYNDRLIEGSDDWSNHAWALAVDLNPATNPRGHDAPVDMPPGTSAKAKSLGMRWGGDYKRPTKRDGMHFEFMGTPAQAAARVQALHDAGWRWEQTKSGLLITDRPGTTAHLTVQEDDMSSFVAIDDTTHTAIRVNEHAKTWRPITGFELIVLSAALPVVRGTAGSKIGKALATLRRQYKQEK